jgi:hypothetical protein
MFIPYPGPNFFHPGSRVTKIPDPKSGSASKNLSILSQKIVSQLSKILSGMFISDPNLDLDFYPSRIPNAGIKLKKAPDHGSATLPEG